MITKPRQARTFDIYDHAELLRLIGAAYVFEIFQATVQQGPGSGQQGVVLAGLTRAGRRGW